MMSSTRFSFLNFFSIAQKMGKVKRGFTGKRRLGKFCLII
jgi:hypothetical protein